MSLGQVRMVLFRTRFFAAFSSAWFELVLLGKGHVGQCHACHLVHQGRCQNGGHVTKRDIAQRQATRCKSACDES